MKKLLTLTLLLGLATLTLAQDSSGVRRIAFNRNGFERSHDWQIAVIGNYVYIACYATAADYPGIFRVVDVTNPARPTEAGFCELPSWSSMSIHGLTLTPRWAYVAGGNPYGSNGLTPIDISTPSRPVCYDVRDLDIDYGHIVASENYLYCIDRSNNVLRIKSMTTPSNPRNTGTFDPQGYPVDVTIRQPYAYITTQSPAGIHIVDITDPARPAGVVFTGLPAIGRQIVASEDYAYIACDNEFIIVDLTAPWDPQVVNRLSNGYFSSISGI
ncbi:MAG: hypothetical protein FJY65_09630 [Calditrichaeota bacterium]|nr:hypothetical protein [Calditrichota bacterium]